MIQFGSRPFKIVGSFITSAVRLNLSWTTYKMQRVSWSEAPNWIEEQTELSWGKGVKTNELQLNTYPTLKRISHPGNCSLLLVQKQETVKASCKSFRKGYIIYVSCLSVLSCLTEIAL